MNKVKIALVIFSLLLSVQKWYNPSPKDEKPLSRPPIELTLVLNQNKEDKKTKQQKRRKLKNKIKKRRKTLSPIKK